MSTPIEYLAAGKLVKSAAKDEAMYRAAINRLYYASFHASRAYYAALPHLGKSSGTGSHEQLITSLANPSDKLTAAKRNTSIALSKVLRTLCQRRVKADYHPDDVVEEGDMLRADLEADSIFGGTKI